MASPLPAGIKFGAPLLPAATVVKEFAKGTTAQTSKEDRTPAGQAGPAPVLTRFGEGAESLKQVKIGAEHYLVALDAAHNVTAISGALTDGTIGRLAAHVEGSAIHADE